MTQSVSQLLHNILDKTGLHNKAPEPIEIE